jgi:hypothetical protein
MRVFGVFNGVLMVFSSIGMVLWCWFSSMILQWHDVLMVLTVLDEWGFFDGSSSGRLQFCVKVL